MMWGVTVQQYRWWESRKMLERLEGQQSPVVKDESLKRSISFVKCLSQNRCTHFHLRAQHIPVLYDFFSPVLSLKGHGELKEFVLALGKAAQRKRSRGGSITLLEKPKTANNIGIFWAAYLHTLHWIGPQSCTEETDLVQALDAKASDTPSWKQTFPLLSALKHLFVQLDAVVNTITPTDDDASRGGGRKRRLPPAQARAAWLKYFRSRKEPGIFDIELAEHVTQKTPWHSNLEKVFCTMTLKKAQAILKSIPKGNDPKTMRAEEHRVHYLEEHFNPRLKSKNAAFFDNEELAEVTIELNWVLSGGGACKTAFGGSPLDDLP